MITNMKKEYKKYSLMDMKLINDFDNGLEQMKFCKEDSYYPLSPQQMGAFRNQTGYYFDSADDVWSLGITALCYIYYEDFNVYYNWSKKSVNMTKIKMHLEALQCKNYF